MKEILRYKEKRAIISVQIELYLLNTIKKMKKLCFIIPPHVTFGDFISPSSAHKHVKKEDGKMYGNLVTDMPLGPLALSSYLKKFISIQTSLIDFNVDLTKIKSFEFKSFLEYFISYLSGDNVNDEPDIIAISSLFSPSYDSLIDISKACRSIFPNACIIAGGNIPSTMFREIFLNKNSKIDAICYGEGEKPLLELLTASDYEQVFDNGDSWITSRKINSNLLYEPKHDFIEDLDEIPIYDYGLCKDNYFINPAFTTYGGVQKKNASIHVMTSRGCPFKCVFCASHKVHGRKMRYYSIDRVKEEFRYLKEKRGVETLIFQDDHFMGDKKRALEIVRYVGSLGLKAIFQNSIALYALNREMLEAIREAGVDQLVLSIESGSDRVLKRVMRKPLKLSIVEQVAKDCRDLGIYTYANILIGLPGETKDDIEDARKFLRTTYANWFGIFCATPLVGSEMFDICKENNYLGADYLGADYKKAVVETEDWTAEYIQEMTYTFNIELNFVYNSDFRIGDYTSALEGFERAIKAKSDHAIAYYYASLCYKKLNMSEESNRCENKYNEYVKNPFWKKFVQKYDLPEAILN